MSAERKKTTAAADPFEVVRSHCALTPGETRVFP